MDAIGFLLAGVIIGGATAFIICHFTDKKDCSKDEKINQEIFDALKKLKADIESTVS
jgi:hypothetical protein